MSSEKQHYLGHRGRLKKRLQEDSTSLADYEILELVLGHVLLRADTKPLAKALLQRFANLRGVFDASDGELLEISGFGPSLLAYWKLLREFMARYLESKALAREDMCSPEQVARIAVSRLSGVFHEEVWAAFLGSSNKLISWVKVETGTVNFSHIYVRELLEKALRYKATGIILVHNHPGGSAQASAKDLELTRQIGRAAQGLGIRLLDHLIVADGVCYSFTKDSLL